MKCLILCLVILLMIPMGPLGVAQESVTMFKNQNQSGVKWGSLEVDPFLDFKTWKESTDEKALVPEWESIVRERNNREIVGRFFHCVGVCHIDRGTSFFNPSFRSSIYEGDEIQTIGESYAWIFLFDGTMVRLSPESSINLSEINIGKKENFISARINAGNVLWLSRSESPYEEINSRETDVIFNPLPLYEAQAVPDRKPYDENDLFKMIEEKQTTFNQYKNLNALIDENNKMTKKKRTFTFLVTANTSIMGFSPSVEVVRLLGGKTYLKARSDTFIGLKNPEKKELKIQLRGFENKELRDLEEDKWMEIDEKGRSFSDAEENLNWLSMGEFITRRIPSLMVARELMMQKYSEFAFREKYDPKVLAAQDGYRLWQELSPAEAGKLTDLNLRVKFLEEYFRRIETTNLLMTTRFSERLKQRGENLRSMEYGNYFFIKALDKYYSYEDYSDEKETGEVLNSTTKTLWKRMHGIR